MDTVTSSDVLTMPMPGTMPAEEDVSAALSALADVRDELKAVVLSRESLIETALICLLTGEHLLQLGPPGTAKSLLMEEIARRVGDPRTGMGLNIFRRLMDKYTTPEDILGPIDASQLKHGVYRHLYQGTLATADVALLDEVFKSSTAILNSLLLMINERKADIGTNERIDIPLITLFLSSNEPPQDVDALLAFYDRILMRSEVRYLEPKEFMLMMASRAAVTRHRMYRMHGHWYVQQNPGSTLDEVLPDNQPHAFLTRTQLYLLQQVVPLIIVKPPVIEALSKIRSELAQKGIVPSDRRWGSLIPVLQANALLHERDEVTDEDMTSIIPALWNKPDEITEITKQVRRAGNPKTAKIREIQETADTTFASYDKAMKKAANEAERVTITADALTNLKAAHQELATLRKGLDEHKDEAAVRTAESALGKVRAHLLQVSSALSGV